MLIKEEILKKMAISILKKSGSNTDEAQIVADHLVRSNLSGHDSHGVGMLPTYMRMLKANLLKPNQAPELFKLDGSIMMFDGKRGYGQAVGKIAMDNAIKKCRTTGLVLMTLRNAHHLGRIGTYGEQSIAAGFISLHFVNVTDHPPVVCPYRGTDARFNTNPICLAMPGTKKQPVILLDMATSKIALGKARVAYNMGQALKEGLLVDHSGQPSREPAVMAAYMFPERSDNPPVGALTPLGDYKGYGLALFCELLGGMLSGGGTVQPEHSRKKSIINNMFTILVDPKRLIDLSWLQHEVEEIIKYCKASPPTEKGKPVLVAGEPERNTFNQRRLSGIPLDDETCNQLQEVGKTLGLSKKEIINI